MHLPNEPPRDPQLADAIRRAEGTVSDARLELLRARIAATSAARLDARRERTWWEWTAQWARAEVVLGLAAGVVALLVAEMTALPEVEAGGDSVEIGGSRLVAEGGMDSVVAHAVTSAASAEQVLNEVVGPVSDEWLYSATVQDRGVEDRSR